MRGIYFVFPSVTDDIILTWSLTSTPLVEAGRSDPFAPSIVGYTYLPPNLLNKAYNFKFYSSSDGVTLETLLQEFFADGSAIGSGVEVYHYVVDGPNDYDPESGQSELRDERLFNKEFEVSSRGVDFRRPDEYEVVNEDPYGGFDLLGGEQFNSGDTFSVMVIGGSSSSTSIEEGGINEITADDIFDDSYLNVTNIANGSGAKITVTFTDFAGIDGKAKFTTYTGTQRYLVLDFDGQEVSYLGEDRTYIALAQNEMIELTFKDGACYVTADQTRMLDTGETVFTNKKTKLGTFLCDGSGTEYNISDFQRLIDELPEEMKVSYSDWNLTVNETIGAIEKVYYKNRGKFAVDEISGKFKFPDGRGMSFRSLLYYDGTADITRLAQGAGGVQAQGLIEHDHGLPNDTLFNGTSFGGQQGSDDSKLDETKATDTTGSTEQRVDNLGKYVVVIL